VWLDEECTGGDTAMLIGALLGTVRREAAELVERRVVDDGDLDAEPVRWTEFRMTVEVDWLLWKVDFPWLEPLTRPSTREGALSPLAALTMSSSAALPLLNVFQSHSPAVPLVLSQRTLQPAPMPSTADLGSSSSLNRSQFA
jgi:hypothetical protein